MFHGGPGFVCREPGAAIQARQLWWRQAAEGPGLRCWGQSWFLSLESPFKEASGPISGELLVTS